MQLVSSTHGVQRNEAAGRRKSRFGKRRCALLGQNGSYHLSCYDRTCIAPITAVQAVLAHFAGKRPFVKFGRSPNRTVERSEISTKWHNVIGNQWKVFFLLNILLTETFPASSMMTPALLQLSMMTSFRIAKSAITVTTQPACKGLKFDSRKSGCTFATASSSDDDVALFIDSVTICAYQLVKLVLRLCFTKWFRDKSKGCISDVQLAGTKTSR